MVIYGVGMLPGTVDKGGQSGPPRNAMGKVTKAAVKEMF